MAKDYNYTHENEGYKCPWCGNFERDMFEMHFDDDVIDTECPKCDMPIRISEHVSHSYTTKPLDGNGEVVEP